MNKQIFIFLLLSILSVNAQAQEAEKQDILYITDQLRLSLYQSADSKSNILEYLRSGEKLIIEEISGPYAFVTTEAEKQGWVRRGFLVSKRPTILLLREAEEKIENLNAEIEKFSNSKQIIEKNQKDIEALAQDLATTTQDRDTAQANLQKANQLNQEYEQKQQQQQIEKQKPVSLNVLKASLEQYWFYLLIIFILFILIGFFLAKLIIESRLKKKFQGVRIW